MSNRRDSRGKYWAGLSDDTSSVRKVLQIFEKGNLEWNEHFYVGLFGTEQHFGTVLTFLYSLLLKKVHSSFELKLYMRIKA